MQQILINTVKLNVKSRKNINKNIMILEDYLGNLQNVNICSTYSYY